VCSICFLRKQRTFLGDLLAQCTAEIYVSRCLRGRDGKGSSCQGVDISRVELLRGGDVKECVKRSLYYLNLYLLYSARDFSLNPIGNPVYPTWEVRTETKHTVTFMKQGTYSQAQNFTGKITMFLNVH
jgi:hypothetical protein